jgi:hypothetical protein
MLRSLDAGPIRAVVRSQQPSAQTAKIGWSLPSVNVPKEEFPSASESPVVWFPVDTEMSSSIKGVDVLLL